MTTQYIPTPTQEAILKHAIDCTGCHVEFIPPQIRGGARNKVLENLIAYGLIEPNPVRPTEYIVTAAGCAAVGREVPADTTSTATEEENAPQAGTPADEGAKSRPREGSKQAQVIAMLEHGATVAEICEATGWLKHTVRGFFAGALKKKGIELESWKTSSGRTYRVRNQAASSS